MDKKPTFDSKFEAMHLPEPERGKGFIEYAHASIPQFKVRVHPPDAAGRVRRQYAVRTKRQMPDKTGQLVERDDRPVLGLVQAINKTDTALDYKDAMRMALEYLKKVELLRSNPNAMAAAVAEAKRMTVADAWTKRMAESRTLREMTVAKEEGNYSRYLQHLADRPLVELDYSFWTAYVTQLAEGKRVDPDNPKKTVQGRPLREGTLVGIINTASSLYETAHKHDGLPTKSKDWNPAREAKAVTRAPNKRRHHIPLEDLGEVWRAADVLCAPWARDQLRLYLLTGLRHSLMTELEFKEVDFERRMLLISPHKIGTKRRAKDTPDDAAPLHLPLCKTAVDILQARLAYAPDKAGPVWYTVVPPSGKAAGRGIARHGDPRSNWVNIVNMVLGGVHFTPHDTRRTFATASVAANAPLIGVSLLMMHSPRTLAKTLGLPDITIEYMNTAVAQRQMRLAADAIEAYVLGLANGSITADGAEPQLPPMLQGALRTGDE